MNVTIRPYHQADWEGVCAVHDAARPLEVETFMPPGEVLPLEAVAEVEGFFNDLCWVACVGDTIAGFVCIDPPKLTWLYVDPKRHRQGIGRALVEYVLPKLVPDAFLTAIFGNQGAVRFYEQLGFRLAAVFPGHCQGYACICPHLRSPAAGTMTSRRNPRPNPSD